MDKPAAMRKRTIPTLRPLSACPAIASTVTGMLLSAKCRAKLGYKGCIARHSGVSEKVAYLPLSFFI